MNKPYSDRGMIKWQPFNSIINGKQISHELSRKRNTCTMPYLMDEEIAKNNKNILCAYNTHSKIKLQYFDNYEIKEITSLIRKINSTKKEIVLEHQTISFYQIINVGII